LDIQKPRCGRLLPGYCWNKNGAGAASQPLQMLAPRLAPLKERLNHASGVIVKDHVHWSFLNFPPHLTSCSVNVKIKEALWRIVEIYLTRWKCEESFRYIKQCYNLEDIRVRLM
jgi:hypothetical protein